MKQVEEDYPSRHKERKLPILDLRVWIENDDYTISYEFYRKDISNWFMMLSRSAMPHRMQRTILTQEAIRILRNCKLDLPWERKAQLLSIFCERLRDSGYASKMRFQIIVTALKGFDKMVERERSGGRPINPSREWQPEQRRLKKLTAKINWYRKGGYTSVLFVPWTPGSELANQYREIEAAGASNRDFRIKIVERCGTSIKSLLQKSDPWASNCGREDCFPCKSGNTGNCHRTNINYRIDCVTCAENGPSDVRNNTNNGSLGNIEEGEPIILGPQKATYWGESARNGFTRGKEHLSAIRNKNEDNAMWKHCVKHHRGDRAEFKMKITSTFKDPLSRLIREGVNIVAGNEDILMNSKSEFKQGAVGRVRLTRGLEE